jgi:hypothetical protein
MFTLVLFFSMFRIIPPIQNTIHPVAGPVVTVSASSQPHPISTRGLRAAR